MCTQHSYAVRYKKATKQLLILGCLEQKLGASRDPNTRHQQRVCRPGHLSAISIHQGIWGSVLGSKQAFSGKGVKHMHVCVCVYIYIYIYIYVYNHYIPPLYSAYRSLKIKLSKSNKTVFVTVTSHDMHVLNPLWLFATSWTVAPQVSLFMGLPRQEILEWVAISFSKNILKFFLIVLGYSQLTALW